MNMSNEVSCSSERVGEFDLVETRPKQNFILVFLFVLGGLLFVLGGIRALFAAYFPHPGMVPATTPFYLIVLRDVYFVAIGIVWIIAAKAVSKGSNRLGWLVACVTFAAFVCLYLAGGFNGT